MSARDRLTAVMVVLLLLGGAKLAHELYRFYAFRAERIEITRLEAGVEREGFGIITSQLRADTLRQAVQSADEELRAARAELEGYERQVWRGDLAPVVEQSYRDRLAAYNRRVSERNALFQDWRASVEANRGHIERYQELAERIRSLAAAMGEPYYPVLTPAEIAARRGLSGAAR